MALCIADSPIVDAPRRVSTLSGGTRVLVERMPAAKSLSVQMFWSADGVSPSIERAGWRHLLEHLVAIGRNGQLDHTLEIRGMFLNAATLRTANRFEILGAPEDLETALAACAELLAPPSITADSIAAELRTLAQEDLITEPERAPLRAANSGIDVFGDPNGFTIATSDSLAELHRWLTSAPRVTIAIAGDVDLDKTLAMVRQVLSPLLVPEPASPPAAIEFASTPRANSRSFVAMELPEWGSDAHAARLAIALFVADASRLRVVFDPTVGTSTLTLVGADEAGVSEQLEFLRTAGFNVPIAARRAATKWLGAVVANPSAAASVRGQLLMRSLRVRPESFLDALQKVPDSELEAVFDTLLVQKPGGKVR